MTDYYDIEIQRFNKAIEALEESNKRKMEMFKKLNAQMDKTNQKLTEMNEEGAFDISTYHQETIEKSGSFEEK
ncbi:hypothetical protein [Halobacillus sp. Marseille-P3879]|uniref:hypothetical protein n=1 Tax=Halobacillus sp. Marseille-P3879 TaxID=2045014 RepID=UPI000C7972E5|nr:hypothetical protein [Halobacillus sp. Marseille-P3879]